MGLVRSSEKSSGMSPSACDTNWVKVIEISDCFEEDVYDISVDGTHCFFANGMLVHNCHHIAAASWTKIFQAYPKAFHIGLTATPARLDGAGLGDFFQAMVHGPSVGWLIENGYLSPYKIYAPAGVNLSGVHMRMGDFKKAELNVALDKPTITGDAIREYRKRAMGKRAIAFCVSIEHSKHVVASFNAAGIPAVHVDGETDVHVRDQAIKDFEAGRTMVLSNVDLFGEGFDLPAIEVGILLRPTASLGLYLQQVGRVLRTYPGKRESILLDHAGNVMRHGLPDDERDWSLRGVIRDSSKSVGAGPSVRVCPKCFAANRSLNPKCCDCGHVFEIQAREVAQVEGELVEVDPKLLQRQRRFEQSRAETLEDIIALGTQRGYKNPKKWAEFIWNARQQKRAAKVTV
jgi:superfamily II DNA or RNA helicase